MPLLAYCIIETAPLVEVSHTGVAGVPIESVEHEKLRCFLSQNNDAGPPTAGAIRDSAPTFYRVLEEIFKQAAVIPFRFPTIFTETAAVTAHLEEHSSEYYPALVRLKNMVQMEIRLQFRASAPTPQMAETPKLSGTEYLQKIRARHGKLEKAAKVFGEACAELTRGWKQSDAAEGLRCFALIERSRLHEFQKILMDANIDSDLVARLSGPWPATQFLKEE